MIEQLRRKFRHATAAFFRPAIFAFDVLALYIACQSQSLAKSAETGGVSFRRSSSENPDQRNRGLLGTRGERPRSRRAAEKCDKFPSLHEPPRVTIETLSHHRLLLCCASQQIWSAMSGLGQKQTSRHSWTVSALPPTADI